MFCRFDGGVGTNKSCATLYEDKSCDMLRVNSELAEQPLPGRRLQGGEPNQVVTLMEKDEPNSASAQIARSIKHDDKSGVHRDLPDVATGHTDFGC